MDLKIMKCIVDSSNIPNEKSKEEWHCQDFPITKNSLIKELSKIFTNLLTYKVSQEVHQRYSVRLHLIGVLRDWCQVKGGLNDLRIFKDSQQTSNFFIHFLKKYLTDEIISYCDNADDLIQLAEILLDSLLQKRIHSNYFEKVIKRITSLNQNERSEKFLSFIIKNSDEMKLESSLVENIYLSQKQKFIEKPLTDSFLSYCADKNNEQSFSNMSLLFEKVVYSPLIFQCVSNQLKEIFIETKYSQISQDFIRGALDKIEANCNKNRKTILELYPVNLQFCIILLRIKKSIHSENSRNHTFQSLKEIFLKDYDAATMLVSHFPEWLPEYLGFYDM